jgi:hypothetical protein
MKKSKFIFQLLTGIILSSNLFSQDYCTPFNACNLICKGGFDELKYDGIFQNGGSNSGASNDTIWRYFTLDTLTLNTVDYYKNAGDTICIFNDQRANPTTFKVGECYFNTRDLNRLPNPDSANVFVGMIAQAGNSNFTNRETLGFTLRRSTIVGAQYGFRFFSRKGTNNCPNLMVYIYGGNQRPCSAPVISKIDGTASPCGFRATLIDSIAVNSANWTFYSDTITTPGVFSHILLRVKDTLVLSDPAVKYGYFDNIEMFQTNQTTVKITASIDTFRTCRDTGRIQYTISVHSNQPLPIDLRLNLPQGIFVRSGGDFDSITRGFFIPANTLNNGNKVILTFLFRLDASQIILNNFYDVALDAITSGYCIHDLSKNITYINPSTSSLVLNDVVVQPDCNRKGSITLAPSGGGSPYIYKWNVSNATTSSLSNLENGTYSVTVTDSRGCTAQKTFTLFNTRPSNFDGYIKSNHSCQMNTTELGVKIIAGDTNYFNYTYSWSNGVNGQLSILATDMTKTYTVTITQNSNGCQYVLSENPNPNSYIKLGSGFGIPEYWSIRDTLTQDISKKNIRIKGDFKINNSFYDIMVRYCDILLEAGASITLSNHTPVSNRPITLTFQSNNIYSYSCAPYLAKGIEVDKTLTTSLHTAFRFDNNEIRDCYKAIEVNSPIRLYVTNSLFENNVIGVHNILHNPNANGVWFHILPNNFSNTIFRGTGSMKQPYPGMSIDIRSHSAARLPYLGAGPDFYPRPWAGIINENYMLQNFGDKMNANNKLKFERMQNGIINIGETIYVYNAQFTDMARKWLQNGTGLMPFTGSGVTSVGGYPRIENTPSSTFNNCNIGVYAPNSKHIKVANSTMTQVAQGIYFSNLSNVSISDIAIEGNTISAAKQGIYLENNNFQSNKCTVASNSISLNSIPIFHLAAKGNGITVVNNMRWVQSMPYLIRNNQVNCFDKIDYGISLTGFPNTLKPRDITVRNNTVSINSPITAISGIRYNNSFFILDSANSVSASNLYPRSTLNNALSPKIFPTGISYEASEGIYTCNTLNNIRTGARFFGACKNSQWRKNKIQNHFDGLRMDNGSSMVPQFNVNSSGFAQGNGNTFTGTCDNAEANSQQTGTITRFYYANTNATYLPNPRFSIGAVPFWSPFTSTPSSQWESDACSQSPRIPGGGGFPFGPYRETLTVLPSPNTFSPLDRFSSPLYAIELSTIDTSLLTNTMTIGAFQVEQLWQYRQLLFNKIKPFENEFIDTSVFRDFISQMEDGSMNEFTEINQVSEEAMEEFIEDMAGQDILQQQIDSAYRRIAVLDSTIWADSTTDAVRQVSRASIALILASIAELDSLRDAMAANARQEYLASIASIQTINDSILHEGIADSLAIAFNTVYYQTYGGLNSELTPEQYATYASLANHCPMKNYDVVYRSRAIVEKYNDSIVWQDSILCSQIGITLKSTKPIKYDKVVEKPIIYSLYPNPTNGVINISISQIPKYPMTFVVSDLLGRELYRKTEDMQMNVFSIDTKNWDNGVYLLRLINGNQELYHSQIQVLK